MCVCSDYSFLFFVPFFEPFFFSRGCFVSDAAAPAWTWHRGTCQYVGFCSQYSFKRIDMFTDLSLYFWPCQKRFFFIHDDIRRHAVELLSSWWVGETSALLKETCGCLSFEILWILNRCRSVIVWVCSKFPVLFFPQLSNWNNVWILYVGGNIVSSTGLCIQLQTLWM